MQSSSQIITTNKPTSGFLQAGCPSCRPTNSVKALKEKTEDIYACKNPILASSKISLRKLRITCSKQLSILKGQHNKD